MLNSAPSSSAHALNGSQGLASHRDHGGDSMQKSWGADDKTLREQKLTSRALAEKISARIYDFPAKDLARAAGCSQQTAENAKRGFHTWRAEHLLNAAGGVPELTALIFECLGISTSEADFYARMYHAMKQQKANP